MLQWVPWPSQYSFSVLVSLAVVSVLAFSVLVLLAVRKCLGVLGSHKCIFPTDDGIPDHSPGAAEVVPARVLLFSCGRRIVIGVAVLEDGEHEVGTI